MRVKCDRCDSVTAYNDKLKAELAEAKGLSADSAPPYYRLWQELKAEVERLKSQDLTHAVIAADVDLRNRCDELKAALEKIRSGEWKYYEQHHGDGTFTASFYDMIDNLLHGHS